MNLDFRNRFQDLLARRLYLQTRNDVVTPPPGGHGPIVWVVGRSLCHVHQFAQPPLEDAAREREAATLAAQRAAPFRNPGHFVAVANGRACAWLWDREPVELAMRDLGLDPARMTVVPETVLREPLAEGFRLAAALEGYDAQRWSEGRLVASRWWPEPPSAREWVLFQRGAGQAGEGLSERVPEPEHLPWLRRPWADPPNRNPLAQYANPRTLMLAGGVAFGVVALYLLTEQAHLRIATFLQNHEVASLSDTLGPALKDKARALEATKANAALLHLQPYEPQLTLMALVAAKMPNNGVRLSEWAFQNGQVEVTVTAGFPLDTALVVKAFQSITSLDGVVAEQAGSAETLRLRAKVKPRWP